MSITRCVLRWGLVGALGLGAVTLLVGTDRVSGCISMIRGKAQTVVDNFVDDPVALRRQLQDLADQYPDRILEVRKEIAQVEHQLGEFEHASEIAKRVVADTTSDLGKLKTLVARAEESARTEARPVAIRFEGVKFDIDEAYTEARRINTVRGTYQDRLAHDQQQINFLTQQKQRLGEILEKLETEHNTFMAQLWQLDRQIDAIARNERLIEMTEEQQATLASYEKFGKIGSLKQLEGKLAELRAVQEAQLEALNKRGINMDYENKAQYDLSTEGANDDPFADIQEQPSSDDGEAETPAKSAKSYAFAEPIVIE
ncbi:MAG: hypothetical protein L0Y44_14945 [Phycisphaerales bacterium]|nr:hypothetical protein [Phycisphaerales bacterium]MCI0631939.1 hypothetical protein [Phycisphaerales bacterium]MCI0677175.1 hypothetical protein [Phycisphaerales bacterium]